MNNYDGKDYTDIGILDIIIENIELDEIIYQSAGYQFKVTINFCNEQKNKTGYQKTYFKQKSELLEFIDSYIIDLEWLKINEFD